MKWLRLLPFSSNFTTNTSSLCRWLILHKAWNALEIWDYLLTGPLLTVCILCGVVGGLICIITFAKFLPKLEIYRHLLALAVWDFSYAIVSFFLYNAPTLLFIEIELANFSRYAFVTPFIYYVSSVSRVGGIWTVVVLAVHKYMALCHPYRYHRTSTKWRGWLTPLLVALCSIIYSLPRFFELTSDYCYELTSGDHVPYIHPMALRDNKTYWLIYRVIGGSLLHSFVPFVLLLWLTCRLWLEIRRLNPKPARSYNKGSCRPSLNPQQQRHNPSMSISLSSYGSPERPSSNGVVGEMTAGNVLLDVLATAAKKNHKNGDCKSPIKEDVQKMPLMQQLVQDEAGRRASSKSTKSDGTGVIIIEKMNHSMHVIVITKFLVCQLLPTVMDILETLRKIDVSATEWTILSHCSVFLATFNCSCNFFIYYLTSSTFKFDCRSALSHIWTRKIDRPF